MGIGRAPTGIVAQREVESADVAAGTPIAQQAGAADNDIGDAGANPAVPSNLEVVMNRIERYLDNSSETPHCGDYVIVNGAFNSVAVTHHVARDIRAALNRWIQPRWIEFNDRSGSLIRLRTHDIHSLIESTVEQRASDRRWARARSEEEKADRNSWDSEEW